MIAKWVLAFSALLAFCAILAYESSNKFDSLKLRYKILWLVALVLDGLLLFYASNHLMS